MSTDAAVVKSDRPLDPSERIAEVLFGLIMELTFTCTISAAEAGRQDIRTMLFAALGCYVVWGVIDAVLYLMGSLAARGQCILTLLSVRGAASAQDGQRIIAGALPPVVASVLQPEELERLRQRLNGLPEPPARPRLTKEEWKGAAGV